MSHPRQYSGCSRLIKKLKECKPHKCSSVENADSFKHLCETKWLKPSS